jgi:hypothetical protein
MYKVTNNFKEILEVSDITDSDFDLRHYMFSANSTKDIAQYINYVEYLKVFAMESKRTGLFELGFLPLIMPPSFLGDKIHREVLPKLQGRLSYYPVPAMSLLNFYYHSDYPDIWIHRLDAAELVEKEPYQVRVKDVLEALT